MSKARQDLIVLPEIFLDCFGFGGRLDDNEVHNSLFKSDEERGIWRSRRKMSTLTL